MSEDMRERLADCLGEHALLHMDEAPNSLGFELRVLGVEATRDIPLGSTNTCQAAKSYIRSPPRP